MGDEPGSDGAPGAGKPEPARYARPDVRRVLAALDVGGLYRVLGQGGGLPQREIARPSTPGRYRSSPAASSG